MGEQRSDQHHRPGLLLDHHRRDATRPVIWLTRRQRPQAIGLYNLGCVLVVDLAGVIQPVNIDGRIPGSAFHRLVDVAGGGLADEDVAGCRAKGFG